MKQSAAWTAVLLLLSTSALANNLRGDNSYWTCASFDEQGTQWLSKSSFKKVALNKSYAQCKQQSVDPATCMAANEHCEAFIKGYQPPKWQCSAFDKMGEVWPSDYHRLRDDAAVGAKVLCKQQSVFPSSCYVRLMTCKSA